MMKGVIRSIDEMVRSLDQLLSSGRLKPSEREVLAGMRKELFAMRRQAAKHRCGPGAETFLRFGALVVRAAELLERFMS